MRHQDLQGEQNTTHTDGQEFQNLEFFVFPEEIKSPPRISADHNGHERPQQNAEYDDADCNKAIVNAGHGLGGHRRLV